MKQELVRKIVPRSLRNWLRSPLKSLRYIMDRMAYTIGVSPSVAPADDWIVTCHPAARFHFNVFRHDRVQAEELSAFIQHCKPGMQLLDIGAHYGFFALACLHFAGPNSRVLCVEASANASSILRSNLKLNDVEDKVDVQNCAMGERDGVLHMLTTGPLGGDYFVIPTEARSDTVSVPQRTIVSLLKETGFKPTHIKIDIESFEYEVLHAAESFLCKNRPVLFLELHGDLLHARNLKPAALIELLKRVGYSSLLLSGENVSADEMERLGYNCRLVCIP